MKIALGSDHGGFALKREIADWLEQAGHEVLDMGADGPESVDYPDYADRVCRSVLAGESERGILICGTGIGMSMVANRHRGIRAALCHDAFTARMSREHNDANVLCLGGRVLGPALALDIVAVWLATAFEGGRHQRSINLFC